MALYYSEAAVRASATSLSLSLSFKFSALPFSTVARFAWPRGNLNGNVNSRDEHVHDGDFGRFVSSLSSLFFSPSLPLSLSVSPSRSLALSRFSFHSPRSPSSSLFVRASAVLIEIFRPGESAVANGYFARRAFHHFFFLSLSSLFLSGEFHFPSGRQNSVRSYVRF